VDTSRIDRIIRELEKLQDDANGIINTYVDYLVTEANAASFGATKAARIFPHAGSQLNYVKALRHVRERLQQKEPA
jgi:hypothetical protein